MRWVICVFTLSCLLLPLLQMDIGQWNLSSLESAAEPTTALAERVEEQTRYEIERQLLPTVQEAIEAEGAKLIKFHLDTDSGGESSIDITQVEVVLRSSDAPCCERVRQRLEDMLGLTVLVSTEEKRG